MLLTIGGKAVKGYVSVIIIIIIVIPGTMFMVLSSIHKSF